MKIHMTLELPVDNEIQFFDVCAAAAAKLSEMGQQAIDSGDHEPFRGTTHPVVTLTDDAETVGMIRVSR